MPFTIIRQDITKMRVDAIVNAANTDLRQGGGVCGAIFSAAGAQKMQEACDQLAPIRTGSAAITPGFQLPANYVIHAVGPVYRSWDPVGSETELRSAYLEALTLAEKNGCESIAFPLISSGIYGYPKKEALEVAKTAILDYLKEHEMEVYLAVFDPRAFSLGEELMGSVRAYIDEHYVSARLDQEARGRRLLEAEKRAMLRAAAPDRAECSGAAAPDRAECSGMAAPDRAEPSGAAASDRAEPSGAAAPADGVHQADEALAEICDSYPAPAGLDALMEHLDEPFSDTLLRLIDQKGKTDVEVYKKANIDRRLFSKIRSGKGYTPKKPTILALAVALELTLEQTDDLLERAGYALSHASKFDVIVEYFILTGQYDIFVINEVLFQYDQPLLGSCT
ncbi:MAG: macro domain-containing protein [Lachnospiraceae bacterium]|nr:macro domain-containing protein [Lachnospiraceae bacterium]